jgi:hypothetical protein
VAIFNRELSLPKAEIIYTSFPEVFLFTTYKHTNLKDERVHETQGKVVRVWFTIFHISSSEQAACPA